MIWLIICENASSVYTRRFLKYIIFCIFDTNILDQVWFTFDCKLVPICCREQQYFIYALFNHRNMTDESVIEIILETFLQKCNENRLRNFIFGTSVFMHLETN